MPKFSIEGAIGIAAGIVLFVLDKKEIGGTVVYGLLFVFAFLLCADSVIRSEWANSRSRRICSGITISAFYLMFGFWIFFRPHKTLESETGAPATHNGSIPAEESKPAPRKMPKPPTTTDSLVKPAAFTRHVKHPTGFLQFDKPQIAGAPYNTIAAGKHFGVNFRSHNKSPERVLRTFGLTASYILPATNESDKVALDKFAGDLKTVKEKYASGEISGPEVAAGENGIWGTSFLHISTGLTSDEAEGIMSKNLRIYYVSWLAWTDLQGRMDWSDDCRWLQIPDGPWPYTGELVWHFCNPSI